MYPYTTRVLPITTYLLPLWYHYHGTPTYYLYGMGRDRLPPYHYSTTRVVLPLPSHYLPLPTYPSTIPLGSTTTYTLPLPRCTGRLVGSTKYYPTPTYTILPLPYHWVGTTYPYT